MSMFKKDDLPKNGYWHVAIRIKKQWWWTQQYNMSLQQILISVIQPYRMWEEISVIGNRIQRDEIDGIKISHTDHPANSFPDIQNGKLCLYKNLFDGAPNSRNFNILIQREGLDTPFLSYLEYQEKLKSRAKINLIQNQTQNQEQIVKNTIVADNYEALSRLIENYADAVKELKKREVNNDLLEEAKEVQDMMDSLTKDSDESTVTKTIRRLNRVITQVKDLISMGSEIVNNIELITKIFNV